MSTFLFFLVSNVGFPFYFFLLANLNLFLECLVKFSHGASLSSLSLVVDGHCVPGVGDRVVRAACVCVVVVVCVRHRGLVGRVRVCYSWVVCVCCRR